MSTKHDIDVQKLDTETVKNEAREIGFDLVGVADAEVIAENPPPGANDITPEDLVHGAASVIALADRTTHGASSIRDGEQTPRRRTADYANNTALGVLEEKMLDLLYYLEDNGHPSLTVQPEMTRSRQYDQMDEGPLSLPHVAVEAGLGTLGLNLQLLTPEYGPRVILGAIVTTADLEPDGIREEALCEGAKCGRCLLASPGDAVEYFDLSVEDARPYTEPWGFHKLLDRAEVALDTDSSDELQNALMDPDTMMIWQSMLRGAGVYTGSTRMADVCPVGEDYDRIREIQRDIPEATDEKRERLANLRRREAKGELPEASESYQKHRRWIGDLDIDYSDRDTDGFIWDYEE